MFSSKKYRIFANLLKWNRRSRKKYTKNARNYLISRTITYWIGWCWMGIIMVWMWKNSCNFLPNLHYFAFKRTTKLTTKIIFEGMKRIKITQVRSAIDKPLRQKRSLEALGIRKMHQTVEHNATPQILGIVNAIKHLVTVEEI